MRLLKSFESIDSDGVIIVRQERSNDGKNMTHTDALRAALTGPILRRSLVVALVVGTALNAINQGDAILAGAMPVLWKAALTYSVPFLVASYGAYSALTAKGPGNG